MSQYNNNNNNNNSNSNGLKRSSSNGRPSSLKRQSLQPKVLNLGQATTTTTTTSGASSGTISHRRSSSMGASANNNDYHLYQPRYSSNGSRKSMVPNQQQGSNRLSMYGGSQLVSTKDPRPLRDKNYQLTIQQEIMDFLTFKNLFEIEMKHPLTNKTLRQPTQKDFVLIFQWLYKKIDPGYKFNKSIEQEVYFLLKTIKYPYLDSINKSQISAVGGQNWPTFLGMLHWMIQLNLMLMKLDDSEEFDLSKPPSSSSSSSSSYNKEVQENGEEDDLVEDQEDIVEKLFIPYILKSYKAFLNNEDDYSEYYAEMEKNYDIYNQKNLNKIDNLKIENSDLEQELNKFLVQNEVVLNSLNKSKILKDDISKFQDYINKLENSKSRWDSILQNIRENIEENELKLKNCNIEKGKIYEIFEKLGFTVNSVENLYKEKEKLSNFLENLNLKIDTLNKIVKDKEISLHDLFNSLETVINSYNSNIYKIISAIELEGEEQFQFNFEINSFNSDLLNDNKLGLKPDQMIPELKKNEIRSNLIKFKNLIISNMHKLQDETIKLQESLDLLQEQINEKQEDFENLETRLSSSKLIYDELYEQIIKDSSNSKIEIENLQNDLQILKFKKNESLLTLNKNLQQVMLRYDNLKYELNLKKIEIFNNFEKYLEFIINFKLNIQGSLEEFENLVIEECAKEFNSEIQKEEESAVKQDEDNDEEMS
ncbi:hypothetical protein PACTADRAFT_31752 [Pachysolen tannophilus NRRL Y-2460]|uniref:Kinetochore protein NDC80 n=1 Tax=Pachysolen tannophilus NRRL Y-2460 TaxID=669874 RepID=A0A1E4U2X0_PACTA|nr:hypothetical protein PACTADRAFT_31752 [Pachysolen tannophilus NRRL Y-2460]